MIDINDDILLRKILMKHFTEPENSGLKNITNAIIKDAKSQTCADEMKIEILVENNIFKEINFEGTACAVATSSADIFINLIKNKSLEDTKKIIDQYQNFLNTGDLSEIDLLEDLVVFKNINKQKNRILCANLAIEAINEIIE